MADGRELRAHSSGATHKGMRAHNERLILSTIRRHGELPGSDLARSIGLSAQTISNILKDLEADGLLEKGQPRRGKVGKPSIPMRLNPDGVFSFGVKIGRRSADLALMDFHGLIRRQLSLRYHFPDPVQIRAFVDEGLKTLQKLVPAGAAIAGIGLAAPREIAKWDHFADVSPDALAAWNGVDLWQEISDISGLPVFNVNDATSACRAEKVFGRGRDFSDYLYVFVGAFIGGGVVLGDRVVEGRFGNAGALGPLPSAKPDGTPAPLLDTASLYLLEAEIMAGGGDVEDLWRSGNDWSAYDDLVAPWVAEAARQIARAGLAACAVMDFEAIVIDGAFPAHVRSDLTRAVAAEILTLDTRGIVRPSIEEGSVGANARAIGAAYMPISAQHFLPGHAVTAAAV